MKHLVPMIDDEFLTSASIIRSIPSDSFVGIAPIAMPVTVKTPHRSRAPEFKINSAFYNNAQYVKEEFMPYIQIKKMLNRLDGKDVASLRDILYRMNTVDPIERETMNRGFKRTAYYDCPHNHVSSNLSVGRDDTTITGLMNHEISALFLWMMKKMNHRITIHYHLHRIFMLAMAIALSVPIDKLESFAVTDTTIRVSKGSPNLRYLLLQGIHDSTYNRMLNYGKCFTDQELQELIKLGHSKKVSCFGYVEDVTSGTKVNIEPLILEKYSVAQYGYDELSHNMNQYPMYFSDEWYNSLKDTDGDESFTKTAIKLLYVSESFRRIFHNTTIVIQQVIIFGFIDHLQELMRECKVSNTLRNPIDEILWREREFHHTLLRAHEYCESEESFVRLFEEYLTKKVFHSA